jgi:hypothetical protein
MSMGPLGGILGSAAGSQSAQSGSDVARSRQEAVHHNRQVKLDSHAENTAGIAETDGEDHQLGERDADGRRPWELPAKPGQAKSPESTVDPEPRLSRDATGMSGSQLDLSG